MQRIYSPELSHYAGKPVQLAGWLHRLRQLGNVSFLVLRDSQGLAQIVIEEPALREKIGKLYNETVISVQGTVVAVPQAPGGYEVHDPVIEVLGESQTPPPFDLFRPAIKAQLPTILDYAPLALRHPRQRAIFRLSSATLEGFRRTLRAKHFVEVQTPKIVASATESGANVFELDYFGRPAYLAQSPQFYKQMLVGVFERVFEVGPVFRAEPHDTPRHINEYVSLDVEMGFIQDHTTVMALLRSVLAGMLAGIEEYASNDLALLNLTLPTVPEIIPALHFTEAQELILRETGEDARHESDLAPAHERWLGEWAKKEHGSDFLFVVGYPMSKRPFYTHPDPTMPGYSRGFDLLFRGLELVTGGQRLHQYNAYITALTQRQMPIEPFEGYLQAFQFGMPPHGGFAIGLERWLARLIEVPNIRETTLFPRDLQRLTP